MRASLRAIRNNLQSDGSYVGVVTAEGRILVYDCSGTTLVAELHVGNKATVVAVRSATDGECDFAFVVAAAVMSDVVIRFGTRDERVLRGSETVRDVAWSPVAGLLAVARPDVVEVWRGASLDETRLIAKIAFPRVRAFAWNRMSTLAIVGPKEVTLWRWEAEVPPARRRDYGGTTDRLSELEGAADARSVVARGNDFLLVTDATIQLFGAVSPEEEIREAKSGIFWKKKNDDRDDDDDETIVPVVVRSGNAAPEEGERSLSGFGGGAVPAAFLLRGAGGTDGRLGGGGVEELRGRDDGPRMCLLEKRDGRWVVGRSVKVALPGVAVVDVVAAADDVIVVASSFSDAIAFYDPDLRQTGVRHLGGLCDEEKTKKRRVRGLCARKDEILVLAAEQDAGRPLSFKREKDVAEASLLLLDLPRKKGAPPTKRSSNTVAPSTSTPLAARLPEAPSRVSSTAKKPPDDTLQVLRDHVDRRFDALEAKLDSLLLLVASIPK